MLEQKQKAIDFTLLDQDAIPHTLSHQRGTWVLLYFYPKDNTPGCTKQACGLSDTFPRFQEHSVKIWGISTDSIASHKKFAEKYHLPFTLLADSERQVVEMYGVWQKKKFMGREYMGTVRTSFLVNPSGEIEKIYSKVNPLTHAQEVLGDLEKMVS